MAGASARLAGYVCGLGGRFGCSNTHPGRPSLLHWQQTGRASPVKPALVVVADQIAERAGVVVARVGEIDDLSAPLIAEIAARVRAGSPEYLTGNQIEPAVWPALCLLVVVRYQCAAQPGHGR